MGMKNRSEVKEKLKNAAREQENDSPDLDLPDAPDKNAPDSTVNMDIGDAEIRRDALDLIRGWAGKEANIVYAGGALPPLFPEEPRPGMCRVLKWAGHTVVEADRAGTDDDFVSMVFDVVNPADGSIVGRGQMNLNTTMEAYFKVHTTEIPNPDSRKKPTKKFDIRRKPEETPMLLITYSGITPGRKNKNPAKLWIIEEIRGAQKALGSGKAGR